MPNPLERLLRRFSTAQDFTKIETQPRRESRPRVFPSGINLTELEQTFKDHRLNGGDILEYEVESGGKIQKKVGVFGYFAYGRDEHGKIVTWVEIFPRNLQPTLRPEDSMGNWRVTGSIPERIYDQLLYETLVDKASPVKIPLESV